MTPFLFFWVTLKASLLSFSGLGNVPSLHDDLVPTGHATDTQFAESIAVGQVSPGPAGLWVVAFGYLVDGLRGAAITTVAITLPPLLVLLIERAYQRVRGHPAVEGFVRGLSLAVVGVFVVVLFTVLSGVGINTRAVIITLVAAALGVSRRVPVFAIIVGAAVVGMLWKVGL